jgi:hypothetical protein
MDNRHVDVTSVGRDHLRAALSILWANASGGTARCYRDVPATSDEPRTLVFYWGKEGEAEPLPVPLDLEGAVDLASRWLDSLDAEEKPGRTDMDGDCEPEGFRVFCEGWGHVFGHRYAFAAIQGRHAWYGK